MGSGDRDVDTDGEPDQDSILPFHRAAAAGRARSVSRRRIWGRISRNIFASLSIQRLASHYRVGAHGHYIRSVVFRGHTRCHQHLTSYIHRAWLRYTRLEHGPAHDPAVVLASYRRPQRDVAFKPQHHSAWLLHAIHPEFERYSFNSKDCPNQ